MPVWQRHSQLLLYCTLRSVIFKSGTGKNVNDYRSEAFAFGTALSIRSTRQIHRSENLDLLRHTCFLLSLALMVAGIGHPSLAGVIVNEIFYNAPDHLDDRQREIRRIPDRPSGHVDRLRTPSVFPRVKSYPFDNDRVQEWTLWA